VNTYTLKTERAVRDAFWLEHPSMRRQFYQPGKEQNSYPANVCVAWCDYVDALVKDGTISNALAARVTL